MGIGLQWAGANSEMAANVRQRIMDQIAAEQRAKADAQQGIDNSLRERQFQSNEELKRAQLVALTESRGAGAADRLFKENQGLNEAIPANTFIAPDSPIVGRLQPIGALKPQDERPAVDVGPLLPGDTGAAMKQGYLKMATSKQNTDAATQADKLTDNARQAKAIEEQVKRDDEIGRHNKAMENRPQPVSTVTIQTTDDQGNKVTRVVPKSEAVGKTYSGAPTGQEANRRSMATSVGKRFDDLQSQIDEAEQRGLLGPGAGRVSEFLAGKVGSTGNPENDDLLGELRMNLSAVRSGFASLHGRGGANSGIAKDLQDKMDSGHMSHAELTGALRGMKKWVDDYAGKPATVEDAGPKQPSGGLPSVGSTFNGAKVLKVEKVQ